LGVYIYCKDTELATVFEHWIRAAYQHEETRKDREGYYILQIIYGLPQYLEMVSCRLVKRWIGAVNRHGNP
jgi:hypothetical protein